MCSSDLNRNGGYIILGVNDKRKIVGVNARAVNKILQEFTTTVNNQQKIYPPLYLSPEVKTINGKIIILIRVPKGIQVCRRNGKLFDRSHDGDIDITNNENLAYQLYARKRSTYFVNQPHSNLRLDCLNKAVIEKARKMAIAKQPNHQWKIMNDKALLKSAGLFVPDPETNKESITLAAILLFGKDETIAAVLPQYKTDAIFRTTNQDRYDDRDIVTTNLIDSYQRLIRFGQKHLNDLFVLEGIVNINARDMILREII